MNDNKHTQFYGKYLATILTDMQRKLHVLGNKQRQEQSNVNSKAGILRMVSVQTSVSKYSASCDVTAWPFKHVHVPKDMD